MNSKRSLNIYIKKGQKMFRITDLEIDSIDREITLTELTPRQAMELDILAKAMPVFQFIYNAISKISDLTAKELEKITMQDSVGLMIYYKATLFKYNPCIGSIL